MHNMPVKKESWTMRIVAVLLVVGHDVYSELRIDVLYDDSVTYLMHRLLSCISKFLRPRETRGWFSMRGEYLHSQCSLHQSVIIDSLVVQH